MRTPASRPTATAQGPSGPPFVTTYEADGVAVVTASSTGTIADWFTAGDRSRRRGTRPVGAFVVEDGAVRWQPTIDVTRVLTTAEIVVGAVLVANRLARRPGAARARVTMGPGGWVSMKGGEVGVRPGSRPWARPRWLTRSTSPGQRAPVWARVLSAVPLQALTR